VFPDRRWKTGDASVAPVGETPLLPQA